MKNRNKTSSNLASIILNRELSGKINSRPSIELLLESSYFSNSDRKHLAKDFPLNDTGALFPRHSYAICSTNCVKIP